MSHRAARIACGLLLIGLLRGPGTIRAGTTDLCPSYAVGLDTAQANTSTSTSMPPLPNGMAQTFEAPDSLIRSITVWQRPGQLRVATFELYITGTDSTGRPDAQTFLHAGPRLRIDDPRGGTDPIPYVFEFDPPLALPHVGRYAFWLFSCSGVSGAVLSCFDEASSGGPYPEGELWFDHSHGCTPGHPRQYPDADFIFRIVFVDADAPRQVAAADVELEPCHVGLTWTTPEPQIAASVFRKPLGGDWTAIGSVLGDAAGIVRFDDREAVPGRFSYSLGAGVCTFFGETAVEVPGGLGLRFKSAAPGAAGAMRLVWSMDTSLVIAATVYRRELQFNIQCPVDNGWRVVGTARSNGDREVVFDDRNAIDNAHYEYRLGVIACGQEQLLGYVQGVVTPASVGVPALATEGGGHCYVTLRASWPDSGAHRSATLYRRIADGAWTVVTRVATDSAASALFADVGVYGRQIYRVGVTRCLQEVFSTELATDVTGAPVVSLTGIEANPARVRVTWSVPPGVFLSSEVQRRAPNQDWRGAGAVVANLAGRLLFEDFNVTRGARYGYRVRQLCGAETFTSEVWIEVPFTGEAGPIEFGFAGARSGPGAAGLAVEFSLPDGAPARLEVVDVAGRRVLARDVGGLGGGVHVLDLAAGESFRAGVYLIRLSRGDQAFTRRAVLFR